MIAALDGQSLVALVTANPVMVLTDTEKFDRFYEEMKRETDAHVPDVTTERGRKAIASLAHKVARTKTAIDDAGKMLNEEARKKINLVDEARRRIREQLDMLKEDVRRPLTEWEAAEEDRLKMVNEAIQIFRDRTIVPMGQSAEDIAHNIALIEAYEIKPEIFQGHYDIAVNQRDQTVEVLKAAHARVLKEEADRAELDRLRAESETRAEAERLAWERQEEEARIAAEKERQAADAKAREDARKAEIERAAARAAEEAEQKAKREADELRAKEQAERDEAARKVRAEKEAAEKAHAEALAAEKRRADEAIAAQKAEAARIQREKEAAEAEAARVAREQAAREADRKHRGSVMSAAKKAMMSLGADEDTAKKIVLAIVAGEIPAVTLRF